VPKPHASVVRYQMDREQRLSSSWCESNSTERVGESGQRLANAGVNLGKRHRDESDNGPAAFRMRTRAGSTPGSDWKGGETGHVRDTYGTRTGHARTGHTEWDAYGTRMGHVKDT
jgi:hypothetical protein